MKPEIIGGILAEILITLPRIKMADLYEKCKDQIEGVGLAQFRLDVGKWINNETIPGYEIRTGPSGGICKKESKSDQANKVVIDPIPVAEMLDAILNNQSRITAGELFLLVSASIPTVTENQFRHQLSIWLKDGTIPGYDIKKGKAGGIVRADPNVDRTIVFESEDIVQSEGSFTVEISPTIRIVKSDERNWTIQKKGGESWISRYYHPSLKSALKSVTKHIINGEFKLADSTMVNIKDAIKVLSEIEKRIEVQLAKTIDQQHI